MSRFAQYLKDTRTEMKHVSWPTTRQALIYSLLVIGISIVAALYLGAADYLFTGLLDLVV